ncbi:protein arginine N-methyltransferase 7 [Wyeomyia smithii]|uniref:protein arginine N-methyltransferase 7 n=1 Tax=Wyeomyia smithii TaxID=174621 RepID=UPI002468070C|nr:protein arginine N-methyltransferase 7 [Wyeomyia smithii]
MYEKMDPESEGDLSEVDSDKDFDLQQEIARSAFADMCHDWERNQKYDQALQLTIKQLHRQGMKAHVLDIGTGSGLLSMMAVRAGADSVTACEAFKPMADCAERVMLANGMAGRIHLVKKKSTEMQVGIGLDMERKANVLVTELFDTELIGEGAIATYMHALEFLLESDCRVIPHSATVYAQIVESPFIVNWYVPKLLTNSDGDVLIKTPNEITHCRGSSALCDLQLSQMPSGSFKVLSDPVAIFEFNWSEKDNFHFERHSRTHVLITNSGVPQAVFMWWELQMDLEGTIRLSCAPYWAHTDFDRLKVNNQTMHIPQQNLIPWRDHWMQAIYFLTTDKQPLRKQQKVTLDAFHDEFSLWFGIDQPNLNPAHCSCGFHIAYSRSRIGQLNEGTRNKKILNFLEDRVNRDSVVLVLSEGSLISLGLAAMGIKKVIIIENNAFSRNCMKQYAAFNGLENVEILGLELLTDTSISHVTHVFGEPFFGSAILPWENGVQFCVMLDRIRSKLNSGVVIVPNSFSIYSAPVEFLDLQKICAPLGICEGFDLSIMDEMIEDNSILTDSPVEAQPLWEYPCFALGLPVELASVNIAENMLKSSVAKGVMKLCKEGVVKNCNGIALWVDWHLDAKQTPKTTISTGPLVPIDIDTVSPVVWNTNWRQGVHLLKQAIVDKSVSWSVKCNVQLNKFYFHFE